MDQSSPMPQPALCGKWSARLPVLIATGGRSQPAAHRTKSVVARPCLRARAETNIWAGIGPRGLHGEVDLSPRLGSGRADQEPPKSRSPSQADPSGLPCSHIHLFTIPYPHRLTFSMILSLSFCQAGGGRYAEVKSR